MFYDNIMTLSKFALLIFLSNELQLGILTFERLVLKNNEMK